MIKLGVLGKHLSSRAGARHMLIRALVEAQQTPNNSVVVDLQGVLTLSNSFADEFFAVLVQDKGSKWFRERILVINALPSVRESILIAVKNRLERNGSKRKVNCNQSPS